MSGFTESVVEQAAQVIQHGWSRPTLDTAIAANPKELGHGG